MTTDSLGQAAHRQAALDQKPDAQLERDLHRFDAPSLMALIAKVLREDPIPPERFTPDIPPALSSLVLRLLAKSPADRPGDARRLLSLLEALE